MAGGWREEKLMDGTQKLIVRNLATGYNQGVVFHVTKPVYGAIVQFIHSI